MQKRTRCFSSHRSAFFFFLCAPSQSGERTLYLGHADSELHNLALFTRAVSVSTGTARGSCLDPFYRRENKLTKAGDLGAQLLKCKTLSSELSSACLLASISHTGEQSYELCVKRSDALSLQ